MYNLDFSPHLGTSELRTSNIQNCLLDNCRVEFVLLYAGSPFISRNNVISGTPRDDNAAFGDWHEFPCSLSVYYQGIYQDFSSESSRYIPLDLDHNISSGDHTIMYEVYSAAARATGGTLACVNSDEELQLFKKHMTWWRPIGYRYNAATGAYEWDDGNSYKLEVHGTDRICMIYIKRRICRGNGKGN